MTKLLSLVCAFLAAGLGVWSLVIAHAAVATLDQARTYYVASAPTPRSPADLADRPAVSGGADAPLQPAGGRSTGELAPLPLTPLAPTPSQDRAESFKPETQALPSGEPSGGSRARPPLAPSSAAQLGYTLPQTRPDAAAPSAPAGAPASPTATGPQ